MYSFLVKKKNKNKTQTNKQTNKNHKALNSSVLQNAYPRAVVLATQEWTKSLKALLVLHAKTFEMTKPSIMQVISLK